MRKLILSVALLLVCLCARAETDKQDYVLGPGDMVRVTVYGNPDLTTETRITAAGTINFPLVGEVQVGGTSASAAEKKIASQLESGSFVIQPQVNLVVLQFQGQLVSVLGEVFKPGRIPLDRPSTLTEVLALAGGATANGSELVTLITKRDGKTEKHEYDLREFFERGQLTQNPIIQGDDIIYVRAREVSVLGRVNRPGKYSVGSGVRSVADFLSMAGGINESGADTIVVTFFKDGKVEKREIDVDQIFRSGGNEANIELHGGDSIYVPRAPLIYIYGEVQRPGTFRLERNMSVAQALAMGGGLTPRGTERGIRIKRRDNAGVVKTIEAQPSDSLQVDDVLYIRESLF